MHDSYLSREPNTLVLQYCIIAAHQHQYLPRAFLVRRQRLDRAEPNTSLPFQQPTLYPLNHRRFISINPLGSILQICLLCPDVK